MGMTWQLSNRDKIILENKNNLYFDLIHAFIFIITPIKTSEVDITFIITVVSKIKLNDDYLRINKKYCLLYMLNITDGPSNSVCLRMIHLFPSVPVGPVAKCL